MYPTPKRMYTDTASARSNFRANTALCTKRLTFNVFLPSCVCGGGGDKLIVYQTRKKFESVMYFSTPLEIEANSRAPVRCSSSGATVRPKKTKRHSPYQIRTQVHKVCSYGRRRLDQLKTISLVPVITYRFTVFFTTECERRSSVAACVCVWSVVRVYTCTSPVRVVLVVLARA